MIHQPRVFTTAPCATVGCDNRVAVPVKGKHGHDPRCPRCREDVGALWPEARMDVVGQNGPDGAAYETTPPTQPGRKFDSGKPRYDLLLNGVPLALEEVARVLTAGAAKYSDHNWGQVPNAQTRYLAAGMRHEIALARGEEQDPETGLHHLAHKLCCDLFRLELLLREGTWTDS